VNLSDQLTPNFTLDDLTRSNKAKSLSIDNTPPDSLLPTLVETAQLLERIMGVLKVPLTITSGYRSPRVNTAVGSSDKSHHLKGYAADFVAPQFGRPYDIAKKLAPMVKELGIGQLIFETDGGKEWVHASTHAPSKAANQVLTFANKKFSAGIVPPPDTADQKRKVPTSGSPPPAKTSSNKAPTPNLRQQTRPLATSVNNLLARGVVKKVKSSTKMQTLQLGLLADEVKDNVEHFEPYGFTSHPLPGAEHVSLFFDGDRSHGATIVVSDRRYRLTTLKEGEVALYDHKGNKAHFLADGTLAIVARTKVQITSPLVTMSGHLKVSGKLDVNGSITSSTSVSAPNVEGTSDVTFNKISAKAHVHSGGTLGGLTAGPSKP
jgi:zinc D-Ala-D-Ala carboxypeptidase